MSGAEIYLKGHLVYKTHSHLLTPSLESQLQLGELLDLRATYWFNKDIWQYISAEDITSHFTVCNMGISSEQVRGSAATAVLLVWLGRRMPTGHADWCCFFIYLFIFCYCYSPIPSSPKFSANRFTVDC